MASNASRQPKSYTPPKGAPTPPRDDAERNERFSTARQANLQWAAVIIVGLVIIALVFVLGSDGSGNLDGVPIGGHG